MLFRSSDGATGTRAELQLQSDVAFRTMSLANPDRFVVDLPDTATRIAEISSAGRVPVAPGLRGAYFVLGANVISNPCRVMARPLG